MSSKTGLSNALEDQEREAFRKQAKKIGAYQKSKQFGNISR